MELAIINNGNEVKYLDPEELKTSTLQDWKDAGYGYGDIGVNESGEYGEEKFTADWFDGEKDWEEIANEEIDDHYCVRYWDGNNWKIEIIPTELVAFDNFLIKDMEDPNPTYYFRYFLTRISTGEQVVCTKSNMSGSISPYYEKDDEELDRMTQEFATMMNENQDIPDTAIDEFDCDPEGTIKKYR